MIKKSLQTLLLVLALSIGTLSQSAFAAIEYQLSCDINVHPFNVDAPSDTIGTAADVFLNNVRANECGSHLPFSKPNYSQRSQYLPQAPRPEDAPIKAGSENLRIPVARHEFGYFNDADGVTQPFYYKSFLDRFEILVQEDAVALDPNLIDHLVCTLPIPSGTSNAVEQQVLASIQDCSTDEGVLPVWGGTTLTKQRIGNTIKVVWDFAQTAPFGGRPVFWGKNGNNFPINGHSVDLTNSTNRTLVSDSGEPIGFAIKFQTPNQEDKTIWSGTTTARAFVSQSKIAKAEYDRDQNSAAWQVEQNIPAGAAIESVTTPSGNRNFYWMNIGSIASIWRKPVDTTPPNIRVQKQVRMLDGSVITEGSPADDFELYVERIEAGSTETRRRAAPSGTSQRADNRTGFGNIIDAISGQDAVMSFATGTHISVDNNQTVTVEPGTYRAAEVQRAGFRYVETLCEGVRTDTVTLAAGESKSCLIINEELPNENQCPPEQHYENGTCVPDNPPPPVCPPGEHYSNGTCVPDVPPPPVCPPGEQVIGGVCVPVPLVCIVINGQQRFVPIAEVPAGAVSCESVRQDIPAGVFIKTATTHENSGNVIRLNEEVDFTLDFRAVRFVDSVTLRDNSFRLENGRFTLTGSKGGKIVVERPFEVLKQTSAGIFPLNACALGESSVPGSSYSSCFEGTPFTNVGIRVSNVASGERIIVRFSARLVFSRISPEFCSKQLKDEAGFCGEFFENTATATDSEIRNYNYKVKLYTPCPFLLTRGLGDVILEEDFNYGFDTSGLSCAGVPNIEGEIIQPIPPIEETRTPSTGPDQTPEILIPSNEICKQSNTGSSSIPEAFRNPFGTLSSGLCELKQSVTEDLTRSTIERAITDNVTRFTRENANLGSNYTLNGDEINGPNVPLSNPNYKVYKVNGNMTVNAVSQVGAGSRTFIIENGDLTINAPITFDPAAATQASFRNTPSIAFIVINGSIKVAPGVKELDGVYVSLKGTRAESGSIRGTAASSNPLNINGVVVGDIQPLFKSRSFVGDARQNQGTIVITYGAWLYYNLPPVLRDLVDLQQEQTAR